MKNDWKPRKLPEKQIASQFPHNMAIINTNGLWQSSMNLLKDHPIFEGAEVVASDEVIFGRLTFDYWLAWKGPLVTRVHVGRPNH